MADISQYLQAILSAVYGEDVRGSIHDAIEIINDVSEVVLSTGTAVTSASSSSTGFFPDTSLYFNTNTKELWKCIGTDSWQSQGLLKGDDGVGIASISKTGTAGLVDTYTITYTDGDTDTFTVTNGANGVTGNKWYTGTAISGKSVNPTIFSGSGITEANVGDMYMNTSEGAVYHCTTGGAPSVAAWVYDFTISGGGGGASVLSDLQDVDITSIADGQILVYSSSGSKWINSSALSSKQDANTAVKHTANTAVGLATRGVYVAADGTATQMDYALNKTVPADAVFTDHTYSGSTGVKLSGSTFKAALQNETQSALTAASKGNTANREYAVGLDANGDMSVNVPWVSDDWYSTTATVSSGSFSFSGLDDTKGYGFKPFVQIDGNSTNKNPSAQISSISGAGTASMSVTYTTDADNGATVKLRIIK